MKIVVKTTLFAFLYCIIACCNSSHSSSNETSFKMKEEVILMLDSVRNDIGWNGPIKWIKYFEDTSAFYMASEGKLVFSDYNAAKKFITDTLVHKVSGIVLDWQNINIDSICENTVAINTYYHEDLMIINDSAIHEMGYCTAIADRTNTGWKFRTLHWSVSK